ncbi:hypothetical protein MRX96_025210 [Rhipicephalus microplus]
MQMTAAKVSSVHSLPLYPEPRLVTFEPAMPMDHPLEKLQPGTIIELSGHVLGSPKRFSINLVTAGGDIALHVNPRFDVGNTVFNTFRSDDWEQEEVVQRLPVQQGHNFDFMILVEEMGYKVAFNGLHFADFKHRLLFSAVERLKVDGCVTVHRVEQRPPLGDPSTPFLYMLPGGRLKPGLMVYVSGRPHSEATSFSLNFQCGGLGSDIAFHFQSRASIARRWCATAFRMVTGERRSASATAFPSPLECTLTCSSGCWMPPTTWLSMASTTCSSSIGCNHCSVSAIFRLRAMCC